MSPNDISVSYKILPFEKIISLKDPCVELIGFDSTPFEIDLVKTPSDPFVQLPSRAEKP